MVSERRRKAHTEGDDERTGDEGRAIWEANAVVARQAEARY
jgi:hypothetical protein